VNNISARVDLVALVGCPGLTGLIRSRMASGAAGIDGIAGKGFLVRETVGGDFFGMPEEYAPLANGNKAQGLVGCSVMPTSRGMYRSRHPPRPDPLRLVEANTSNAWA